MNHSISLTLSKGAVSANPDLQVVTDQDTVEWTSLDQTAVFEISFGPGPSPFSTAPPYGPSKQPLGPYKVTGPEGAYPYQASATLRKKAYGGDPVLVVTKPHIPRP